MIGPTGVFGVIMKELADEYENINVVTSDLCTFSGLERFSKEYPKQFFNVGIAEQNMVGIAAGLAKEGHKTFASTYGTFAVTRALDQVRVNMGYMKLPVKLVGLTSGFASGILGATHMCLEDIAIIRSIPNIVILSPADCLEVAKCLEAALMIDEPVYIRLTGTSRMPIVYSEDYEYVIGRNTCIKEGHDICIFSTGSMVSVALKVAEELDTSNVSVKVYDVHTLKPFNGNIVEDNVGCKLMVTMEEHNINGGLGDIVASELASLDKHPSLLKCGVCDYYPHAASYEGLMDEAGLTKDILSKKIMEKYNSL